MGDYNFNKKELYAIKSICIVIMSLMLLIGCTHRNEKNTNMMDKGNEGDIQSSKNSVNYLIKPEFKECAPAFIDGIMMVSKKTKDEVKYGFIDDNGEVIVEPIYDDTRFYVGASMGSSGFSEGLAPVKLKDKWGYINSKGVKIIDFKYEEAGLFNDGLAYVKIDGKYGYINKQGTMVIQPQYSKAFEFHKGVAVAQINDSYGFIDKEGKWIIEPRYDGVYFGRYSYYWKKNDKVIVYKNDLQGFVHISNGEAKVITKPKYNKLFPFEEGKAYFIIVEKDEEGFYTDSITQGYIDEDGKEILKWNNDEDDIIDIYSSKLKEGLRAVQNKDEKWGFVDKNQNIVISYKYDYVEGFNNSSSIVSLDDKFGVIDKRGNWLLKPEYDSINQGCVVGLEKNYFLVEKNFKERLISRSNLKLQSKTYDKIGYGEQLIPVKSEGKIGFLNHELKEVIPLQYEDCKSFEYTKGYPFVKIDDEWYVIDKTGKQLGGPFEDIRDFRNNYAATKIGGKWGAVDDKFKIRIPCIFDDLKVVEQGLAKVLVEDKYGFISLP